MTSAVYQRPWLYPKQEAALFSPVRFAFVEASTKSGKTVGCIAWLFEQAALHGKQGRNYWWVAPTLPVAKIAFRRMKRAIPHNLYRSNDSDSTILLPNGAMLWFKGADRPDTLYGEDVFAVVIDEASRCKEDAWTAIRTTLTATHGAARIIGNVKGKHNWAYRLTRKAESKTMRDAEAFKLTADDAIEAGIFPSDEVEDAKAHMPEGAWKELYYAEAADDGSNPFGWDAIEDCKITEEEWEESCKKVPPICGAADFARAQDYTVAMNLGQQYQVLTWERFQRPWKETKDDVKKLLGTIRPCWGDSTGVGDSVVEDLQRMGVKMQGVPFSAPMKQKLMERLRSALQQRKLRIPEGPIISELESFEYTYVGGDQGRVRYSAPDGLHDDCVMALALAVYGRDQMWAPDEVQKPQEDEDTFPGYDFKRNERKKRRYQVEQEVEPKGWRPERFTSTPSRNDD